MDEAAHELVVGNHFHQALAVSLALVGQHAGGSGGAAEVGLHILDQVGAGHIVTAQER